MLAMCGELGFRSAPDTADPGIVAVSLELKCRSAGRQGCRVWAIVADHAPELCL